MTDTLDPRRVSYLPLAELEADPRNPKAHDTVTIDASIGRFGMLDLIVRDERTGRIVSGHGRFKVLSAMAQRGETPPEGVRTDEEGGWLIPVITGWASRTDTEASAALIALNRTTELGGWVDDALLDLLDDLAEEEGGFEGVGFTEADREALAHLAYSVDDGPRDLDELHASVGDVSEEDHLGSVILRVPREIANALLEALGEDLDLHLEMAQLWLDSRGEGESAD